MDLRRLRYFLAVAEDLHFGRAAERLGITQPALSQQVNKLEAEFGATLIERTSRTVSLTDAGQDVLEPLRRCVAAYEEARTVTHRTPPGDGALLRIGFPLGESSAVLTPFLRRIAHCSPGIRIELTDVPCDRQATAIREGALDVGFMHLPILEPNLAPLVVRRDRLVVAMPGNHPCARERSVDIRRLEEEPFIGVRLQCPAYADAVGRLARHGGFTPRVDIETDGIATTMSMVADRLGVAIVPGAGIGKHPGVAVRDISPVTHGLDLAFVLHRGQSSPFVRRLHRVVQEASRELAQDQDRLREARSA
ncbi:LysR family transcriptional regulator [Kitasatospora sp. NPDC094011]|uniref:LysR family transcriptional regulator n=1 Tax=Kitasatospora sp. NPDC094011 TaxID=3364090 RepID=UPI0038063EC7